MARFGYGREAVANEGTVACSLLVFLLLVLCISHEAEVFAVALLQVCKAPSMVVCWLMYWPAGHEISEAFRDFWCRVKLQQPPLRAGANAVVVQREAVEGTNASGVAVMARAHLASRSAGGVCDAATICARHLATLVHACPAPLW